jgi:diguanylate cyclase (GGDEF)-like protein
MTLGDVATRATEEEAANPSRSSSPTAPTTTVGGSSTKRTLLLVSHAMERAFSASDQNVPGLVLALFQRREYFDHEAAAYAALAASGHTVIVGFSGSTADLPAGVHAVAFDEDDPRARDWVLVLVRGDHATALVATDSYDLAPGELTLQASRLFHGRQTFSRIQALADARAQLTRLSPDLPADVVRAAETHVSGSEAIPVSTAEVRLSAAADHLVSSLEAGHRRATRLRCELVATMARAEEDHLTGLGNRHFLERFLGAKDRPADLLVLLADVDGLKSVNDTYGHEAGDALLSTVAATLRESSRPTDVVVRWGGDEFIILVPDAGVTASEGALAIGERLADAVRATHLPAPWAHLRPSVSVGVSSVRRTVLPLAELDTALQHLKRNGKGHAALAPGVWPG